MIIMQPVALSHPPLDASALHAIKVIAAGDGPRWRLEREGSRMHLHVHGRSSVTVEGVQQRLTRRGVEISGQKADGATLTLRAMFGVCRRAGGSRPARYIANISFGSLLLKGCFFKTPPGERPILD